MMSLQLMQQVMDTLNDRWESPLAAEIAARWGYDEGTLQFFRASANFLFVLQRGGQDYFLRFNADSERSVRDISLEIDTLLHLQTGLRTAVPVPSRQERYVETVETELGSFHAVLFERLPGVQYEFEELKEEQFFTWGQALGQLHCTLQQSPVPARQDWRGQLLAIQAALPAEETAARAEAEEILAIAGTLPQTPAAFGLIHYDFEPDNLRWEDGVIGILDFDDSIQSWYAADIAYALRDVFAEGVDMENPLFQQFLAGYRSAAALEEQMLAHLPFFLRMHRLVLFAKLRRSVDLTGDAGRLAGLQEKLQQRLALYRKQLTKAH